MTPPAIAKAIAALEPFAGAAEHMTKVNDSRPLWYALEAGFSQRDQVPLTVADLRRAASALAGLRQWADNNERHEEAMAIVSEAARVLRARQSSGESVGSERTAAGASKPNPDLGALLDLATERDALKAEVERLRELLTRIRDEHSPVEHIKAMARAALAEPTRKPDERGG